MLLNTSFAYKPREISLEGIPLLLEIKVKASCMSGKMRGLKPALLLKEISGHVEL